MQWKFMEMALKLAYRAYRANEWPVGAVIVKSNKIIAANYNQVERKQDPTAHAELLVIKTAVSKLGKFLDDCEIYITVQPCEMCYWTLQQVRISKIFYGTHSTQKIIEKSQCYDCLYENSAKKLIQKHLEKIRT